MGASMTDFGPMNGGPHDQGSDERLRGSPRGWSLPPACALVSVGRQEGGQGMRVLILSWEYPPLIEGGLARHVRKLAENLVCQDVDVHVLTRGREESPAEELAEGVRLHRVLEPKRPAELASSSPGSST